MKSRASIFIIAFLAALLNIGVTAGLIYLKGDKFNAAAGMLEAEAAAGDALEFQADRGRRDGPGVEERAGAPRPREIDLGKLEAQIKSEKEELEKVRADIEAMRDQISQSIPRVEEAEVKNIKSLAKTYSSVKPTAAVAIFKELDDNTVVKILSFMKAETAGAILAEMSRQQDKDESMAKRAARISDKLRLLEPLQNNRTANMNKLLRFLRKSRLRASGSQRSSRVAALGRAGCSPRRGFRGRITRSLSTSHLRTGEKNRRARRPCGRLKSGRKKTGEGKKR